MARRRVIVGVGEALLRESGGREQPAGLGLLVPLHAVQLGHEGVAVSRVGQDATGDILLSKLRDLGVDVDHLQTDPDLPTGRLVVSALGTRGLEGHAAFDNLQWDFDLEDVAQRADAVVFGGLIRRSGQARSAVDRFLAECRMALRVFDLAGRAGVDLNRGHAMSGLRRAEALVIDDHALSQLLPGAGDTPPDEVARELARQADLSLVLIAQEGRPVSARTADASCSGATVHRRETHEATVVALLHGVLAGWELAASVAFAERVAQHVAERPDQPLPPELLQPAS